MKIVKWFALFSLASCINYSEGLTKSQEQLNLFTNDLFVTALAIFCYNCRCLTQKSCTKSNNLREEVRRPKNRDNFIYVSVLFRNVLSHLYLTRTTEPKQFVSRLL